MENMMKKLQSICVMDLMNLFIDSNSIVIDSNFVASEKYTFGIKKLYILGKMDWATYMYQRALLNRSCRKSVKNRSINFAYERFFASISNKEVYAYAQTAEWELHEIGSNLENLINNSENNKISYIAIRGIVKPLRGAVPLQSISKKNITGVIQKFRITEPAEFTEKLEITTDSLSIIKRNIISIYFEVPFALQRNYSSVEIIHPLSADILDLDVIFDTNKSAFRFMDCTGLPELFQSSTEIMEQMLCENSIVTAIGELSRSQDKFGSLILKSPSNKSKPFCITSCSIATLLQELDNRKKLFRFFCVGIIGLFLGGVMVRRYWAKNKRNQRSA